MLVTGERSAIRATVLAPVDHKLAICQTPAPLPKHRTPYFVLEPATKSGTASFLVLLQPVAVDEEPSLAPSRLVVEGGLGARLHGDERTDTVLFASTGSAFADGVRLAGAAGWVRTGKSGLMACALHRGTRLEVGGVTMLSSSAPVDVVLQLQGEAATAHISLKAPAELRLRTGPRMTRVTVNGKTAKAEPDDQGVVTLSIKPED